MTEDYLKGTIHVYFAGGVKDGVIESLQDPEILVKVRVADDLLHVYQLRAVSEPDQKTQKAMRGKQATYVFAGPEYIFEEDENVDN